MSISEQLDALATEAETVIDVPESLREQLAAYDAAKRLATEARRLVADLNEAITSDRSSGVVEAGPWAAEINSSKQRSGFKDEELESDVRRYLTSEWYDDDIVAAVSAVLDMIWSKTDGLCPLKARNIRTTVLEEIFGLDPDDYSEHVWRKSVQIVRRP